MLISLIASVRSSPTNSTRFSHSFNSRVRHRKDLRPRLFSLATQELQCRLQRLQLNAPGRKALHPKSLSNPSFQKKWILRPNQSRVTVLLPILALPPTQTNLLHLVLQRILPLPLQEPLLKIRFHCLSRLLNPLYPIRRRSTLCVRRSSQFLRCSPLLVHVTDWRRKLQKQKSIPLERLVKSRVFKAVQARMSDLLHLPLVTSPILIRSQRLILTQLRQLLGRRLLQLRNLQNLLLKSAQLFTRIIRLQ